MEKELFLTTLKEKSQVDNLSDRTYNEVADMWLPQFADDSKVTDETWAIPIQMLKTMSGQLRHDISVGIGDAKKQWEQDAADIRKKEVAAAVAEAEAAWAKKNEQTEEAPPPAPDIDSKIATAVADAIGRLTAAEGPIGLQSKKLDDFISAFTKNEKDRKESDVRNEIRSHLISRGVEEDDYALEIAMEKLSVGEEPDIKALKEKAEKDYESIFKRMHGASKASPFAGGMGGNGTDTGSGAAAWLKSRAGIAEQEASAAEARKKLLR